MNEAIETIEHVGQTIEIFQDGDNCSPRENDNMCIFHVAHRRYSFGDKNYSSLADITSAERKAVAKGDIVLPLYMYDHSGITIALTPFPCPWDSGQVGFVQVKKSEIIANWGKKNWTKSLQEKAHEVAGMEVKEMDSYLRGEVYLYSINNYEESCGGYIGDITYCIEEAKSAAEYLKTYKEEQARIEAPLPLFPKDTKILS